MLLARERRAARQEELRKLWGKPLIFFTMNIPGPVKDSPLIRRTFLWGQEQLEKALPGWLHREIRMEVTGCEGVYVVDGDALELKKLCVRIEDETPVGRLFDMDVLDGDGCKPDRSAADGKSRDCILCGAPGRGCASRRLHSAQELARKADSLMAQHFEGLAVADAAVESLLEEVRATPKPGLVDRRNSGSHRDMDLALFEKSAEALRPYFYGCFLIGQEDLTEEETFRRLRRAGREAEEIMFRTTGGINTHKGAIFTLGLLCGSLRNRDRVLETCAGLGSCALEDLNRDAPPVTAGERLYRSLGITGIRGEAAAGLPSVAEVGLPAFREALDRGCSRNHAAVVTLLHLIARVEDTNLLHRGGTEGAAWAKQQAAALLPEPDMEAVEALDDAFIRRNLSPGGCADLLAATIFLHTVLPRR